MVHLTEEHVTTEDNPSYDIHKVSGIDNIYNVLYLLVLMMITSQKNM